MLSLFAHTVCVVALVLWVVAATHAALLKAAAAVAVHELALAVEALADSPSLAEFLSLGPELCSGLFLVLGARG